MPYKDADTRLEYGREYRDRNRERQREYMRDWRKTPAGQAWESGIAEKRRKREEADPERYRLMRQNQKFKTRYGMSLEDYHAMLEKQQGLCAVCHREPQGKHPLHVDHCHVTGRVRELLCASCNHALGHLDDDPARIDALAAYARRWSP